MNRYTWLSLSEKCPIQVPNLEREFLAEGLWRRLVSTYKHSAWPRPGSMDSITCRLCGSVCGGGDQKFNTILRGLREDANVHYGALIIREALD